MAKKFVCILGACFLLGLMCWAAFAADGGAQSGPTVASAYPDLATGVLSAAKLGDLPEGVLVRAGEVEITVQNVTDRLATVPPAMREALNKNQFFVVEQMAARRLILELARKRAAEGSANPAGGSKTEQELLDGYVEGLAAQAQVTDEDVAQFYEQNKDSVGGAPLEQVKEQIKAYVLKEKQQEVLAEHVRTLGQRTPIVVAAVWAKGQAALAADNPLDKARAGGTPLLVDFWGPGCRPCAMMEPILADLKTKYQGKANVVLVSVRDEPGLAARYGIRAIPVQVFFDKSGKQTYRHTGFFPQVEIEKKLAEMGVE